MRLAHPDTYLSYMNPTPWRVLVIEDDDLDCRYLTKVLAFYGIEVVTVNNGTEGLHQAQTLLPTLVFTNLQMSPMDGWEFLTRMRRTPATAAIPVVALTAEHDFRLPQRALRHGFNAFIEKPICPPAVMEWVCRLVA